MIVEKHVVDKETRSNVTSIRPGRRAVQRRIDQPELNTLICAVAQRTLRPSQN